MRQWKRTWSWAGVLVAASALSTFGCSSDPAGDTAPPDPSDDDGGTPEDDRARLCPPARSSDRIPQRLQATAVEATMSSEELRAAIDSNCAQCHLAPAENGGFMYQDEYEGGEIRVDGDLRHVPGLVDAAQLMAREVVAGRMPPAAIRDADPAYFDKLGSRLEAWLRAGTPEGDFALPEETVGEGQQLPTEIAAAMTDLGDCVPAAEIVGHDRDKDDFFAALTELPENLADTDLFSLDAYQLAQRGTVAFNVEYPLWADNAHKGRWIHVPSIVGAGDMAERMQITFDPESGQFEIPNNTRFYKTFFKAVKESDGEVRYRKVETRLILVRHAPEEPLYGTYLWDDAEREARLNRAPYRSGEPFKDVILSLEVDAETKARRTYAVPGSHRCNECHQGSPSESFILGFTPLQIRRRPLGEAGRQTPTEEDELSQLDRLVAYGMVAGVTSETAPKLEASHPTNQPRNDYELQVQAYTTGNCGHCHNPIGFARRQNDALTLNLAPGGNVFQFAPSLRSIYSGVYVSPGDPDRSRVYQRMLNRTALEGVVPLLHMPLHTPGVDCAAVELVGKWITSIPTSNTPEAIAAALKAAATFEADCVEPPDIEWLEEDFTVPPIYVPRRADWHDVENGMPESIRSLEFTSTLRELAETPIANGYWNRKPTCRFPDVEEPLGGVRPWMVNDDGTAERPFGEIFYQRPGDAYFTSVCSKCHGPRANGETGVARTLLVATGGQTRVANLIDGLFGRDGANMTLFTVLEPSGAIRNLAGNYLIWMAMGGTQAFFPPDLVEIVGPNGGNMLNLVRESCASLLPGHRTPLLETYQIYETYAKVCAFENPITPELGFVPDTETPLNQTLQNAWLDRAAQNAGWMIFRFLKEEAAAGNWPINKNQCELVYPAN